MNRLYKYLGVFVFGLLLGKQGFAQEVETTDFYKEMKNYDLSIVLMADSISTDWGIFERSEILGFIGDNYQRFYIHFISIIQNSTNPYEYFAYGKTKVKENICEFQGIIKVISAEVYNEMYEMYEFYEDSELYEKSYNKKRGFTDCEVVLYENKQHSYSGFFKGKMRSYFYIDTVTGTFRYDDLESYSDSFENNQFTGNWTSYKTKNSKKCNWGNYRIPDSGDLDIGAAYFSVDKEYVKNGWENYMLLLSGDFEEDSVEYKKALQKENEKWWK